MGPVETTAPVLGIALGCTPAYANAQLQKPDDADDVGKEVPWKLRQLDDVTLAIKYKNAPKALVFSRDKKSA